MIDLRGFIYLIIAVFSEVAATVALKMTEGFTKPLPGIVVVLGYGSAFYFLSLMLKTVPVGIAYAVWSGIGIVLTAIVGIFLFRERLDIWAIVGMSLIIAGIVVMNVLSKTAAH